MGLISFASILITYFVMIKDVETKNAFIIAESPMNLHEKILSGLNGNAMALVAVFVSLIPFVVYLTWIIFMETNNSTELVVISRKISRPSMLLQRFVIAISILFLNSLLALIGFAVVANRDNVLTSEDSISWMVSMFFGYFIASICLMSITLLLSNFMKLITLFMTVMAIFIALPVATVVLSSQKNVVTEWRIDDDERNIGAVSTADLKTPDFIRETNKVHEIYNGNIRKQDFGAVDPLEQTVYKKYSKWDSWMSIASVFNAFSKGKASTHIRDSWTETKTLDSICDFNSKNSINIGGVKYMLSYDLKKQSYNSDDINNLSSSFWSGDFWLKRIILANSLKSKYENGMPIAFTTDARPVIRELITTAGVSRVSSLQGREIDLDLLKRNYDSIITLLKTNDLYATKYKNLSFVYQSVLIHSLIVTYEDIAIPITQRFDKVIDMIDDKYAFDTFGRFGFINAQIIDNSDNERFTPNKMYPNSTIWNGLMERELSVTRGREVQNKLFRNILVSDMPVYEKHYNEEYKPGTSSQIIWLILFLLTIPLSAFIYIRKDLK